MQLGISAIWSQKEKGVAWSGRCHTHFPQKTLKKKLNLTEESQDAKKNFFGLIFNMLMLWGKCMPIAFEFQQGLFCILPNCQTYFRWMFSLNLFLQEMCIVHCRLSWFPSSSHLGWCNHLVFHHRGIWIKHVIQNCSNHIYRSPYLEPG